MMNAPVRIRRAALEDANAIAVVQVAAWKVAYRGMLPGELLDAYTVADRAARWDEILWSGSGETLVAERDGEVTGWTGFGASEDDDAAPEAGEVLGLYVGPASWRTGTGAALWRAACEGLAKSGYEIANAWVLEANGPARRFYEAMGCDLDTTAKKMFERDGHSAPLVRYSLRLS